MSPELAEALKQSEARPKTTFEINQAIAKPPQEEGIEETRESKTGKEEFLLKDGELSIDLNQYREALGLLGVDPQQRDEKVDIFRSQWNHPSTDTNLREKMVKGAETAISLIPFIKESKGIA